ncbi:MULTISPECIES: DUF305 domain-containing protein [Methylobacterium]|jgi:uncharacterized protein (DUF305 family)|uniref:DUF305 domain-containing protein n=1 Tax=Methylobacterium isbiliense TaxID=315478 RepID=A0ABQ4SI43_9HYPH|nr:MULTISPECIES: DUF305 domain-containing protein [Methylobacterium]MBY0298722.1 DUF305 domain-containing protein [Methylobacterium sp.]MDN3625838.1 DUF305 domain-containing protein [Methylobacterium isbiliense]GJE02847.1 hypothetical protein GMJLKIPL_4796 [Methylobacterium isbiliense]
MKSLFIAALISGAALATPAFAQQHAHDTQSAVKLPEACKAAAQAGGKESMMRDMQNQMSQSMQGMSGQMSETQKGLHQAMMSMNGPMMQGMMAGDADVAWICAMIPHHQGAIDMARAGLKGADNAESKRLAEKTIEEQEKSIKELTAWLDKHAKKEGNQ